MCFRICINKGYKSKYIHICSDSQETLFALYTHNFTFHIIWECSSWLCQLAAGNSVILPRVSGYSCICSIEVANEGARNGSSISIVSPEPAVEISSNLNKNTTFDIFRKKQH